MYFIMRMNDNVGEMVQMLTQVPCPKGQGEGADGQVSSYNFASSPEFSRNPNISTLQSILGKSRRDGMFCGPSLILNVMSAL